MTTVDAYPGLLEGLDLLRRRWRMHQVLQGLLLTLGGTAFVLVVLVAADNLFHFGKVGRFLLACCLWGSLAAALLGLVIRRLLEDRRDDFFAMLVEEKHPALGNRLINALQLGRGSQNGFSPRLIEAIVHDAAEATADLDVSASVDHRPTRRALLLGAGGLLLVGGYAAGLGPWFSNGLGRVLFPAAEIEPYTATRVLDESVLPGDRTVAEGAMLTVRATAAGTIPKSAELVRLVPEADGVHRHEATMPADPATPDGFRSAEFPAHQSFEYYIRAGDGQSRVFHIHVVKPPAVESVQLVYTFPAYTALSPRTQERSNGDISGLPGTTVAMKLRATKPLQHAGLLVKQGNVIKRIELQRGEDESIWHTSFWLWDIPHDRPRVQGFRAPLLLAPTTYRVDLADKDGFPNADPLWRPIDLIPDQAPAVTVTLPGQDRKAGPRDVLPIEVQARDDFGLADVGIWYRVNEGVAQPLMHFVHRERLPPTQTRDRLTLRLADLSARHPELKHGGTVQYWATAADRNNLTGPGVGESRRFLIYVQVPEDAAQTLDIKIEDYAQALEEILLLQRENRTRTYSADPFDGLVKRQTAVRRKTAQLARVMERDAVPVATIVKSLDDLSAGLMAEAIKLLESGRDATSPAVANTFRSRSLGVEDKIIVELQALLARLQRNDQAKKALRKMAKKDSAAHKKLTDALGRMIKDLTQMLHDETKLAANFERLPKKAVEEVKEDKLKEPLKELSQFQQKWGQWKKDTVNEMTKLPTGFVDDFGLRKDVQRIYEEIEKAAQRARAQKAEVSLEDLGAGLATRMKEDLEMWMPDSPDNVKWVLEEPLTNKPMKIPEMPLPKELEDMVGDLLQKADEFDKDADDVTSAWGDNLDQAGWGVSDGPISTFSAKGKTGNDLPNSHELSGRSGDGRRGKSSGQMVGDTSRGLAGRNTPARVSNERYEPGQLKQEGQQDPNGATGGGKKAGAGRVGLQGGTPPDMVRDLGRLSAEQAGLREKAEQVARKLDTLGISSSRLQGSVKMLNQAAQDLRDHRYIDAARRRKTALSSLRSAFRDLDRTTATQISHGRDLPPELRRELLQGADDDYPPGYEDMLKNYFRTLSQAEK